MKRMKMYSTYIFSLFICIGLISCNTTTEKKEAVEKEINKIEEKVVTPNNKETSSSKTTKEATSKETTSKMDKFSTFMNKNMKEWKLLPQNMWLQQEFIGDYNTTFGIEEKINYEKNTAIKGDFNGNGFTDHIQFLQNSENVVVLMAFHQTENGYDTFEIANYGVITNCCLGAGISITPPGIYTNLETKKDKTIESDAIIYSIYEKSNALYYFDGKKYTSFFISD